MKWQNTTHHFIQSARDTRVSPFQVSFERGMAMRVTQSMLSNNMLRNLNNSYSKMSQLQNQIDSGKKIVRPSDDPVVAVKGMGYRTELGKVEQFIRNTGEVNAWYDTTDMTLGQAGDALNRIKELVVQAANDTNTADDRAKIKAEIDQIRDQLRDLGNTKVAGKSIFTGTNTQKDLFVSVQYYDPESIQKHYDSLAGPATVPPATAPSTAQDDFVAGISGGGQATRDFLDDIVKNNANSPLKLVSDRVLNTTYKDGDGNPVNPIEALQKATVQEVGATAATSIFVGSNVDTATVTAGTEQIKMEVFDGVQLTVNFPGADIFGRLDVLMGKVSDALDPANNPNHETIQEKLGGIVDPTGQDKNDDLTVLHGILLTARADVGARQNRLDLMAHRLDIHEINVTKQMSENEDTDYALAITQMTTAESIHQAALSVGAKIIQQTLVDFMR